MEMWLPLGRLVWGRPPLPEGMCNACGHDWAVTPPTTPSDGTVPLLRSGHTGVPGAVGSSWPLQEMCNVCGHDSVVVLAGPSEDSPVLPGPQLVWGLSKVRRGNTLHTGGHSAEIAIAGS